MSTAWTPPVLPSPAPPLRTQAAVIASVALALFLLCWAYKTGQDSRCEALRAERSPLVAQYCPPASPSTAAR